MGTRRDPAAGVSGHLLDVAQGKWGPPRPPLGLRLIAKECHMGGYVEEWPLYLLHALEGCIRGVCIYLYRRPKYDPRYHAVWISHGRAPNITLQLCVHILGPCVEMVAGIYNGIPDTWYLDTISRHLLYTYYAVVYIHTTIVSTHVATSICRYLDTSISMYCTMVWYITCVVYPLHHIHMYVYTIQMDTMSSLTTTW